VERVGISSEIFFITKMFRKDPEDFLSTNYVLDTSNPNNQNDRWSKKIIIRNTNLSVRYLSDFIGTFHTIDFVK